MDEIKLNTENRFNTNKVDKYDENIARVMPGYQTSHELVQYLLEDTLPATSKILVAGCGTGKEIIDYSTNNLQWQFLGFDPSEKMISIAKDKMIANNCADKVHFVTGLIDDVSEGDFDAATSILVMQFIQSNEEIQDFLNGISGKLKSGAPLVLVYLEGDKNLKEYQILNSAWKAQQLDTRNDDQSVIEEFTQREDKTRFISRKDINTFLNKAGFSEPVNFFKAYSLTGLIAFKKQTINHI